MVVLAWVAAHCCWLVVDRCCSVDCCYCYCYCFFVVDDVVAVLVDVNCVLRRCRGVLAAFVAAAIAERSARGRQNHAGKISVDGWVNLAWRVSPVDFFGRLRNCCSPFGDRVDCDAFCVGGIFLFWKGKEKDMDLLKGISLGLVFWFYLWISLITSLIV